VPVDFIPCQLKSSVLGASCNLRSAINEYWSVSEAHTMLPEGFDVR